MESLIPIGFLVFLFGAAIYIWAGALSRRKIMSEEQEVSFSAVGIVILLLGLLMIAVLFFINW